MKSAQKRCLSGTNRGDGPRWHLAGRLTVLSPCKLTCWSRIPLCRFESADALQAALDARHQG